MRNLLFASGVLFLVACESGPGALPTPPVLKVTSPTRGLVQDHAGDVQVTGTVVANAEGVPVAGVSVNNVSAVVGVDGTWTATVQVPAGATLLHTEAVDANGGLATDTRVVEAGELRAPGANIDNAITVAISKPAFERISSIASDTIKTVDFNAMLAPMQPMQHAGDEGGPDCLYDQAFVDNVAFGDAKLSLVPVDGGIAFTAEIDGLNIPAHVNFAVACVDGSESITISADKVVVSGTLLVTPDGMNGFVTTLDSPNVQLDNFHLDASGVPGTIINMLHADQLLATAISFGAEKFMGPMMNQALGSLAGPKQLNVLGQTVDLAVVPSDVAFDSRNGMVTLNTQFLLAGAEGSQGFIYTDNGMPTMDPGNGLELGIADDLANEALAQFTSLNMFNLSMPISGGTFDSVKIGLTVPPMISADPADGQMRLILGDMRVTFMQGSTPVGEAMLNAKIDLSIQTALGGNGVSLQLGTPQIQVDVTDGVPNATRLEADDLEKAMKLSLDAQITSISALLGSIPLPSVAGISLTNVSVSADDGYVIVKATL